MREGNLLFKAKCPGKRRLVVAVTSDIHGSGPGAHRILQNGRVPNFKAVFEWHWQYCVLVIGTGGAVLCLVHISLKLNGALTTQVLSDFGPFEWQEHLDVRN